MTSLHRSLLVVAGLLLCVPLSSLRSAEDRPVKPSAKTAKPAPEPGDTKPDRDDEFSDSIKLSPNRKAKKSMEAAQDFIQEGAWLEATHVLQGLLDIKEDAFVKVRRRGPDGKEAVHWSSVRAEANRLLGTLPRQGLEVYELQCGGRARELLAEAKKKSDPQLLAAVAQRYLHTKAGAAATELLGTYHLDRGRPVMAVLCFERLLMNEATAAGLKPLTLLKAAVAFHRAGDKARFGDAWQRLAKASPAGVPLGGKDVPLATLQKELDRLPAVVAAANAADWTMFQGSPSRSAHASGGVPFLDEDVNKWQQPTLRHAEAKRWIADAVAYQEGQQQAAALPAFFPVAAKGKLVFRTHSGISAVDLKTGKPAWEHESDWSIDRMAADSSKTVALGQWIPLYLQGGTANILFENSTLGTLCTDNRLVYAVEDLAIPPHPQYLQQNAWGGRHRTFLGPFEEAVNQNQLKALDLETGKLRWSAGGRGGKDELADAFFLGPPLPLAGKLYVLVEKNSEIRLFCLDAETGAVSWKQPLATVRDRLPLDVARRVHAVHLAYGDGILVCPTNAGAILGVDLLTHSLVWAKPYREATRTQEPQVNFGRRFRFPLGHSLQSDWKDAAPIVQDGKVVFTAPDGVAVECLNLRDGSTVWKAERSDDLYLGGVYRGKVLLVGKQNCRALNLADGKPAWTRATGVPSGRGVADAKHYYLPLKAAGPAKEPEVCAIDIDTGAIRSRARTRNKEVPGNLVFYGGKVISQTINQVAAYPQLAVKLAEMNARIAKNPNDPLGLAERGGLRFSEGDVPAAVADLRAALSGKLEAVVRAKVRGKLFEALTELLEKDFGAAEKHLAEYNDMCQMTAAEAASADERKQAEREQLRRRARYLSLLARGRAGQGRLVDALQAYRDFGALVRDGDLLALPGEPGVKARPDVWARGCIAALLDRAKPDDKRALGKQHIERLRVIVFKPAVGHGRRLAQQGQGSRLFA